MVNKIKSAHLQNILVKMEKAGYADSYIKKTRIILNEVFETALDNDLIIKNPVTGSVSAKGVKKKEKINICDQMYRGRYAPKDATGNNGTCYACGYYGLIRSRYGDREVF